MDNRVPREIAASPAGDNDANYVCRRRLSRFTESSNMGESSQQVDKGLGFGDTKALALDWRVRKFYD